VTPAQKGQAEEWGGLEDHHVGVQLPADDEGVEEQDPDVLVALQELARVRRARRIEQRQGEKR
jgi:hypothetical protein